MKRCLACGGYYNSTYPNCPECQVKPQFIDGFEAHAPAFAHENSGFKPEYFSELAELEAANFWFKSRNAILIWALKTYAQTFGSFLEIGCGTAFALSGIAAAFPNVKLFGSEILTAGLGFAALRLPQATFMQMDARDIPFKNEFDVIGAFDVLEHIEEDKTVLDQMHQALKPQGIALLSVPQHEWLWSAADEYACHVRRYTREEIETKVRQAGFEILRSTSFVTVLLPAMMASRLLSKKVPVKDYDARAELKLPSILNSLFLLLLSCELALIGLGINLPVGGSRLVVARRI